jgi:hypothetical protein
MSSSGRPPWTPTRKIDLAFDVYDIGVQFGDDLWDVAEITKSLREEEPYRSKYEPAQPNAARAGVGEELVEEVLNWLRPMDAGDPYDRLEERFPIEFSEVLSRRKAKKAPLPSFDEIRTLLEQAGKMRDELIEEFGFKAATRMLSRSNK